jgi:hypothetical protein
VGVLLTEKGSDPSIEPAILKEGFITWGATPADTTEEGTIEPLTASVGTFPEPADIGKGSDPALEIEMIETGPEGTTFPVRIDDCASGSDPGFETETDDEMTGPEGTTFPAEVLETIASGSDPGITEEELPPE